MRKPMLVVFFLVCLLLACGSVSVLIIRHTWPFTRVYVSRDGVFLSGPQDKQTGCDFEAHLTPPPNFYVGTVCWDRSGMRPW